MFLLISKYSCSSPHIPARDHLSTTTYMYYYIAAHCHIILPIFTYLCSKATYSFAQPDIPARLHVESYQLPDIPLQTYIRLCLAGVSSGIRPDTCHKDSLNVEHTIHDEILMYVDKTPTWISYDIRLISAYVILLDDETAT